MINIEDDVKILKKFNSLKVNSPFRFVEISYPRLQKAISNILSDYTRKKQINEEHQKINGELREKVKELEENNKTQIMSPYYVKENYIPKQVVKDKIKKLKNQISIDICIENNIEKHYELKYKIQILQELLEGESK